MEIQRPIAPLVAGEAAAAGPSTLAARPRPWALWKVRVESPGDGQTVTDPLVVTGHLGGGVRDRLLQAARRAVAAGTHHDWSFEVLLDGEPVGRIGPAEVSAGRFVVQIPVPDLAEGAHLLSLGAPGRDPGQAWSRRTIRLRRTPPESPVRAATRWTLVRLHLVQPSPRPRVLIDERCWEDVAWRVRRNGTGWWGDALLDLAHLPVGRHRVLVEPRSHPAVRLLLHRLSEYH